MNSLHPNSEQLALALLTDDPRAAAVVEAWRFRFPITPLPADHPLFVQIGSVTFEPAD